MKKSYRTSGRKTSGAKKPASIDKTLERAKKSYIDVKRKQEQNTYIKEGIEKDNKRGLLGYLEGLGKALTFDMSTLDGPPGYAEGKKKQIRNSQQVLDRGRTLNRARAAAARKLRNERKKK